MRRWGTVRQVVIEGCVVADLLLFRLVVIAAFSAASYFLQPFSLSGVLSMALGAAIAALIVLIDIRMRRESAASIAGAGVGAIAGLLIAYLFSLTLAQVWPTGTHFADLATLAAGLYLGIRLGAEKGASFRVSNATVVTSNAFLALDTSVIIDGRIADIAETGFLDGQLAVPRFVMRELQAVADSADGTKRNRGRRGLDILQRIQKIPNMDVRILEDDFPGIPEVDLKLIELAKRYGCKVVTNDFNLNKVAQVHKVAVLNVNELANALKPVVLPGEWMRVYILKEGKEMGQGVAYLDDGTMVVVDNARRVIGRTIDISVTSVLQTTAGKMIFARFDEKQHAVHEVKTPVPVTSA